MHSQFKDVPKYKGYLRVENFENINTGYRGFTYNPGQHEKIWDQFILPKSVPILGVYDASEGYPFLNLRYLIDLDLQMIINKLPDSLISALQNKDITVESLTRIYAHIVFFERQPSLTIYSTINVMFHNFYWLLSGKHQFQANLLMGLFNPINVKPAQQESIPFKKFGMVPLNTHPNEPYRISPNNARFEIINPANAFATFWLAAVSPDKKQLSITYVIVMNPFFFHLIDPENNAIKSLKGFLNVLLGLEKSTILSREDRADLKKINTEIRKIVTREQQNTEKLVQQLKQLQNQLLMLENKLDEFQTSPSSSVLALNEDASEIAHVIEKFSFKDCLNLIKCSCQQFVNNMELDKMIAFIFAMTV